MKPFEAPQRSVKMRISLNFFSSFGIGTERVKGVTQRVTVNIF